VQYKQMTPVEAFEHVRFHRPRVLLASAQWKVSYCNDFLGHHCNDFSCLNT
jgi:hypothetical protein